MSTTKLPTFVVRPCPYSSRGFAIVNRLTGEVKEGGFFSRHLAQEYIWREYERPEGEA